MPGFLLRLTLSIAVLTAKASYYVIILLLPEFWTLNFTDWKGRVNLVTKKTTDWTFIWNKRDGHYGNGSDIATKQKVLWVTQWLYMCIIHVNLCTFLCHPLHNNNVKWISSVYFGECEQQQLIFCILIWTWTLALHI